MTVDKKMPAAHEIVNAISHDKRSFIQTFPCRYSVKMDRFELISFYFNLGMELL